MRANSLMVQRAVRAAIACGITTGFVFGGSVMAADQNQAMPVNTPTATTPAPTKLKAVEVTGTKIKRTNVEQAQPIQIITQAQIKQTGLTTIGQVLQHITSSGSALNPQYDQGGNGDTTGGGETNLDLRNLGSQRTLVLVNGHRWITALNGTVDLNTIPIAIIDHVEILQDGASAIYGSDAIAGVVNIITVKNFDGAEANAYVGIHHGDGHWDGLTRSYSATIGTGNDRSNVVFNASYENENAVPSSHRTLSAIPIYGTGDTRGSSATPQGRFTFIPPYGGSTSSPNNFPAPSTHLTSTQCPANNFGTDAMPNYLPECDLTLITGKPGTSPQDFRPYLPTDNYNYANSTYLISPAQRFSTYAAGHFDLADNLTFSMEATFTQRNSDQQSAPSPIFIGTSSATASLPASKDYNPFNFALNTAAPIGPGLLISLGRRLVEDGPRIDNENENVIHVNSGFNGYFDAAGSEWDWDAGYLFSKDTYINTDYGQLDANRLSVQLSSPAACEAQAALGCVPINFFGGQTVQITPTQLAFSSYVNTNQFRFDTRGFYGDVSNSDVVNLPAGPVGLAMGFQNLRNGGDFQPSTVSSRQQFFPLVPTSGTTTSDAAYLEVDLPLLADMPFAKLVDLDVATRRTEVKTLSVTNFNTSSKAGLKWQPTEDLLLRGTWSQGFRSPDISELFSGITGSSFQTRDPCNNYLTSGVPVSVQKLCAAQGVPPSYIQPINQISTQQSGNPELKPETSISRTVGFVYSPNWLPGFNVNADYYKIELENTIQPLGGENLFDGCYYGNIASYCARIHRASNGTGNIVNVDDSVTNIGGTSTSGIDIGFSYALPMTSIGQFQVGLQSTYLRTYNEYYPTANGQGEAVTKLAGVERGGTTFPTGFPRWKANANVTWALGDWGASWNIRYVGSTIESCGDYLDGTPFSFTNMGVCSKPDYQNNTLSQNRLAPAVYHNAQIHYTFAPWNTTVTFGVNNIFDRIPPESVTAELNSYDTSLYPIPGRYFYASVAVKF